jgi:hypothetical protein
MECKRFAKPKEEIKLFLNQNFTDPPQSVKHILQPKIALAYQDTNYTAPIILMAQRTEVLRYL